MSGVRALQYIRSRHSSQLTQGTDNARSIRQQAVINAILLKLRSKEVLQNPVILGQLFDWYQRHFGNTISVYELIRMGYDFQEKAFNLEFHPQTLSFELNGERGVITHPDVRKYNQWVYEVKNEEEFKSEIHQKLGL
jgi:anionic cell wall polymer biosynthesis LytR-Cps2A-Psr (LCP) family protein